MARNQLSKYLWVLETIQRHGQITRTELGRRWVNSDISNGEKLSRRTFYNYRNTIEELFGIKIAYNSSTYEYYIEGDSEDPEIGGWLVKSMSINNMLSDATGIAGRIMLEEVPSAHDYLPAVIEAIKTSNRIKFSYAPFDRLQKKKDITIEPYFLRIFRNRWYIIGYNNGDKKIKTYSLDRITTLQLLSEQFDMPDIKVTDYFADYFGITTNRSDAKLVILKAVSKQAKYLRALPLHKSQIEQVCDGYSIFQYKLHITYDLMQEILSFGPDVTVIAPPELKSMVVESLKQTLQNYETQE